MENEIKLLFSSVWFLLVAMQAVYSITGDFFDNFRTTPQAVSSDANTDEKPTVVTDCVRFHKLFFPY